MSIRFVAVIISLVLVAGCAGLPGSASPAERQFEALRRDPVRLAAMMRAFPKGGDIHHHLIGAPTPEMLIDVAIDKGFCMRRDSLQASPPPCSDGVEPVANVMRDEALRERLIDLWSMRGFGRGDPQAAAHFFGIFPLIWPVVDDRGDLLARLMADAAAQNIGYLETQLQVPAPTERLREIAMALPPQAGVMQMRTALVAQPEYRELVAAAQKGLAAYRQTARDRLGCDGPTPEPGCAVATRFQIYALRILPLPMVYADMILAYELAARSDLVVSVNIVGYEGDATALKDYRKHIDALAALGRFHGGVVLTPHAGEITAREADAEALGNHVPLAFYQAGARRIGHGVSIAVSDSRTQLLADLARTGTVIEVSLTSNELLLGVADDAHPFMLLWNAGVPVVLATDDAGIFRTDLSREFTLAASRYPWLGYRDLQTLARRSLEFSQLPGRSLWAADRSRVVSACAGAGGFAADSCLRYAAASPRAHAQRRLEIALLQFEEQLLDGRF